MGVRSVQILKALGDETRLRILFVVRSEPLSVNEILEVLEMGQSRVSRHLRILADAGILDSERQGLRVYYGINPAAEQLVQGLLGALGLARRGGEPIPAALPDETERDAFNLKLLLERRKRAGVEHFQAHGIDQDRLMEGLVDGHFYRRRICELLPAAPGVVADLGCGAGALGSLLLERGGQLIGVDQSPRMLREAARRLPGVDLRLGRLEHLPLSDAEAQVVVLSMALHHMPDPRLGLREARRVLRENGMLIVAELGRHEEETMRSRFGDFWLGFPEERLLELVEGAGFAVDEVTVGQGAGQLVCEFIVARKLPNGEVLSRPAPGKARTLAAAK